MGIHARNKATLLAFAVWVLCLLPGSLSAGISLGGGLTHEMVVSRGEDYTGAITIMNTGDEEEEVKIYQTDYSFTCDGSYYYGDPGNSPRSNSAWIDFSPRLVRVPPEGTVDVSYTISVPDDPGLIGTYWSILMVEVVGNTPDRQVRDRSRKVTLGINQVVRYGVQIVNHVGDTGERRLDFVETRVLREEDGRVLEVDLENVGERWLRPLVWTELYDHIGNFMGRFETGRLRIYPGSSARYRIDVSQIPGGEYKAVVVADCGGDDVFGATYSVIFEHEDQFTVH
jgi:hypothetical protein